MSGHGGVFEQLDLWSACEPALSLALLKNLKFFRLAGIIAAEEEEA